MIHLCPCPTVPNLFPNEDEWRIQVNSGGHSWSFQSIPSRSSSIIPMRVGSGGMYTVFEHVQKLCVVSANKFHSCLCALKTCNYRVCCTIFVLYSSHSHYILRHLCMLNLTRTQCEVVRHSVPARKSLGNTKPHDGIKKCVKVKGLSVSRSFSTTLHKDSCHHIFKL